jgi:hypothetical protein
MGDGGARWRIPQLTEKIAMQLMDYHRADVHGQQIGGGGEEVRDGGGDEAVHDAGWSWQGSYHKEMPRPVLRGGCSQEEFKSFKQHWNQYAKYHNGMDVGELRQQLLNCADGALETLMYDSLGSQVDTLSQTDLFKQLEELAVVVVRKDVKQMVVPKVENTSKRKGNFR